MILEKTSNDRQREGDFGVPPTDWKALPSLAPHGQSKLEGILCCGVAQPQTRQRVFDIVLPSLTKLVGQATAWGEEPEDEMLLGEYRFLILSAKSHNGIEAYVQLWSEACGNVVLEVGPGERPDHKLQAFADNIRERLLDRGFRIGGNADNFRKELPLLEGEEAGRVAREMIAIVVDVLDYDGAVDLGCRFEQASHLSKGNILSGINRSALRVFMKAWGLRPSIPAEVSDALEGRSLYQKFQVQLSFPRAQGNREFWEIHVVAFVTLSSDRAAALVDLVNGRPFLLKAYAIPGDDESEQEVRLSQGINLAGGVTPNHIRDQIFEFLGRVRKLPDEV
jgi:hypothetical protein